MKRKVRSPSKSTPQVRQSVHQESPTNELIRTILTCIGAVIGFLGLGYVCLMSCVEASVFIYAKLGLAPGDMDNMVPGMIIGGLPGVTLGPFIGKLLGYATAELVIATLANQSLKKARRREGGHYSPYIAEKLLRLFVKPEIANDFSDYFSPQYQTECEVRGVFKARLWYWKQVVGLILPLFAQAVDKVIGWVIWGFGGNSFGR